MHHALYIDEIVYNIFGHCHPADAAWTFERIHSTADLAALARTCRTFKEPALDVLWSELIDLSPLACCLPESHRSPDRGYSFVRPRNDAEWETLQSYTRRVWRITSFSSPNGFLDPQSVSAAFDPPLADPLFPNLRFLIWQGISALPATYFAVPSLTSLDIRGASQEDVAVYTHLLDTVIPRCPHIKKVRVQAANDAVLCDTVHRYLRRWKSLQIVDCLDVALPADVMPHLSRIPTLMWLSFTLDAHASGPAHSLRDPLVFSQLVYLEIVSESLAPVTNLLAQVRLPAAQVLIVPFPSRPSKSAVRSHLTTVRDASATSSLMDLRLLNLRSSPTYAHAFDPFTPRDPDRGDSDDDCRLVLDDLRPCMAFANLRAVHVNLEWPVDLRDADVLELVSAWPNVEHVLINDQWGWRAPRGGVTLGGLRRILERCGMLWELCVALDTQSVVAAVAGEGEGEDASRRGLDVDVSSRRPLWLNVADSPILPEQIPALGVALSSLGLVHDRFFAWSGSEMRDLAEASKCQSLWRRVVV